ncbi:hypothetical protein [Pseudomonas sp. A-B-26]|uniref:hypothetical protein n=1 Tax=Pseudomonas sp. A-B-26 TaxID=2832406 RepID=UPI001CBECB23|nr:hypothetical protein [Pseudomonas sp. A-B-26]
MTIIKSTAFLTNYPFCVLPESVVAAFKRHSVLIGGRLAVPLKLFECYCHVTKAQVSLKSLSSASFGKIVEGFLGSLNDTSFVATKRITRQTYAINFTSALALMRAEIPGISTFAQSSEGIPQFAQLWQAQINDLDEQAVRYWNGWEIVSTKNRYFLALANLWHSHGEDFTEQFYRQWRLFFEKKARPACSEVNTFVKFLVDHSKEWPAKSFYQPQTIKNLFLAFMKEYFMDTSHRKLNLNSRIIAWGGLICNCEEAFIQANIWATPFGNGLPKPTRKRISGELTHIKSNEDGTTVQDKLITSVPLYVTDEEAIEIIFKHINEDIGTVKSWARTQAEEIYERVLRRKLLAKYGRPIQNGAGTKTMKTLGLENICATFEAYGFPSSKSTYLRRFGSGTHSKKTAHFLGMPTASALFPFQCLLVAEHPKITPSFLEKFTLFDKYGTSSGFIPTDTGYQLVGFKDRRGARLSEQKIDLTPFTEELIKRVIVITEPLRNHMKLCGDERWRELFLTCGDGFAPPTSASCPRWRPSNFKTQPSFFNSLEQEFAQHTNLRGEELKMFLSRVSLSTLRASCGVAVYLKTKSVHEMSRVLGHARYDPDLLAHYLPKSILAFFQSRWIRIFQRSFICEALKDSPYLIEGTDFRTMKELHLFLNHHALKSIPDHLQDPEDMLGTHATLDLHSKVYVSIDPGVMTALLSLEKAVNLAERPNSVSGHARYWADLSQMVTKEIVRGNDALLKRHLEEAKNHCDHLRMEHLIYETTI